MLFQKSGGNLGTDGSVAYMFTKKGIITFASEIDEDVLVEAALEVGADDVVTNDDGSIDVITEPQDFLDVQEALVEKGFTPDNSEVTFDAETKADLDLQTAEKILNLIDKLEDLDDVQNVYSNVNFTQEIMQQLG